MVRNAGYREIDLQNASVSAVGGAKIPGVYEAIEGSHRTLLITGLTISNVERKPFFATVRVSSDDFIIPLDTIVTSAKITQTTLKVTDEDVVTLETAEFVKEE